MKELYERQRSGRTDEVMAESQTKRPGYARDDAGYCAELWRGVTSGYPALLDTLAPDVDRKIESLSPIERAVLVIGAWELSHRLDIPYRVVINEAVEIAKSYGGTDGHKFVNGVLDKLAPRLRVGEIRASGKP